MEGIGRFLWLIFGGIETAVLWLLLGALWCLTGIGFPYGKQCLRYGLLGLWPIGKIVSTDHRLHPVLNGIWTALGGFLIAFFYLLFGFLWCATLIGVPVGLQAFKFAKLSCLPFGAVAY